MGDVLMNKELFDFIEKCPTSYQTVAETARILTDDGYEKLGECGTWNLSRGGKYYVTRNLSSLIAFRVPDRHMSGFMISASHSDSPCFKIKENAQLKDRLYVKLPTEKYGGMLMATWFDRPLSVAGRIVVKTDAGIETKLVDLKEPVAIIPSVAIHMNRNANENATYNPAKDMIPLAGLQGTFSLRREAAKAAGVDEDAIVSTDLFVYNVERGVEWNGMISAPRLDDLQCVYASLEAFIKAKETKSIPVMCIFDNEEVGSATKQGAASTFLSDTLERIKYSLGLGDAEFKSAVASSMMVSCDNAHAVHPNHPEYADPDNDPVPGGGIVIKYNANQKYTSDAVSSALFKLICGAAGNVPTQRYSNRADIPGGSTLGNISNTKVSLITVDIGIAQLAMHSSYESAGAADTEYMVAALTEFFSSYMTTSADGRYNLIGSSGAKRE